MIYYHWYQFYIWLFTSIDRRAMASVTIHIRLHLMDADDWYGTMPNHFHMIYPHGRVALFLVVYWIWMRTRWSLVWTVWKVVCLNKFLAVQSKPSPSLILIFSTIFHIFNSFLKCFTEMDSLRLHHVCHSNNVDSISALNHSNFRQRVVHSTVSIRTPTWKIRIKLYCHVIYSWNNCVKWAYVKIPVHYVLMQKELFGLIHVRTGKQNVHKLK